MLTYAAGDGETNNLTLSSAGGQYRVVDPGSDPLTVAGDCTLEPPVLPDLVSHSAVCPSQGVTFIAIDLGDEADTLTIGAIAYPPSSTGEPAVEAAGGSGGDHLHGGPGPETIAGGDGIDEITGGPGSDVLQGNDGGDHVDGGTGADAELSGGGGNDELLGGEDDDVLRGGDGDDRLVGGDGNDRFDYAVTQTLEDQTPGSDTMDGGPGDDRMYAGRSGRGEADAMSGGDGSDTVDYGDRSAPLDVSLDGRADDGESGERDDVGGDVEQVIGGANGDTLTGSPAANVLDGRGGDDTIDGLAGDDALVGGDNTPDNDSLTGGAGRDDLRGGPGDDALDGGDGDDVLSGAGGGDELDAGPGDDVAAGGAGVDALEGGTGDDILLGGEAALIGGDGGDSLGGGPGADVLRAGRGNDRLDGGPGPDLLSGEAGTDTVTYEDRTNPVSVTFNGRPDDGERDEHDNVADDIEIVLGGREGDTLTGKAGEDTEDGGPGEDLVDGGPQPDRLTGGDEPDLIRARDGSPDVVLCGDGGDLALVDRQDTVRECETVDAGGRRRLVRGETALVQPERPGFELRLPGGTRFFDMRETVKIPLRSTIDATAGPVRLSTARTRAGARQRATAQQGIFTLRQTSGARPRTRLLLRGTFSRTCRAAAAGRGAGRQDKRRRVRLQIGKPRGRWEVQGAYSSSAAQGTAWVTEDRCDGTHTTVLEGAVRVHDFGRDRDVVVRAGSEYVARPSRRRGG